MTGYCYECDALAYRISEHGLQGGKSFCGLDDETIMMLMHTGHQHADDNDFEQV